MRSILARLKRRRRADPFEAKLRQLFDAGFYLATYPDVAAAGVDPFEHYREHGWKEGRDPSAGFSTEAWLEANPELRGSTVDPLSHVARSATGRSEIAASRAAQKPAGGHPLALVATSIRADFDAGFYLQRYPDVKAEGVDPVLHYLLHGAAEGRDPSLSFDTKWYVSKYADVARSKLNPLFHYVRFGRAEGRDPKPPRPAPAPPVAAGSAGPFRVAHIAGGRAASPFAHSVLLCAHAAGDELFGGERSFVDMARGLAENGVDVHVTLPRMSGAYVEALKPFAVSIGVFGYRRWRDGNAVDMRAVEEFRILCRSYDVDAVHANTLLLREPLLAARLEGVPGIAHIREILESDPALTQSVGAPAQAIEEWVKRNADWLICNSQATAAAFRDHSRVAILGNTIDVEAFDLPLAPRDGKVRIGIISSNLPKKGIEDFLDLADAAAGELPDARFVVVGPANAFIDELKARRSGSGQPPAGAGNVEFAGYARSPLEAVAMTDVVVNFSHFAESFGRTVLEAMAARRPVIAYRWGALPELVAQGRTGFLVPYRKPLDALPHLKRLCAEPGLLRRMGDAGRRAALRNYSTSRYAQRLGEIYAGILPAKPRATGMPARRKAAVAPAMPEPLIRKVARREIRGTAWPSPRVKPRIAYFCWHFPVPSETFVLNELRQLVADGHDVQVFCRQSPHEGFVPDFPIRWTRVETPDELAKQLRKTRRTVAHGHFVYPTVTEFLWPACEQAGVPFTFIAHAQDIFRHVNDERNRIGEIARSPLCLRLFVLSEFHRAYVMKRGVPPDKIVINPNAIDARAFAAGADPERSARSSRAICAIHRFAEKKGLEHLVRAAAHLAADGIRVDLYGYGELEERYRAVIAELGLENVRLCGPLVGTEQLLATLRRYDLFACPSVRTADGDMDGIPTSVAEAMAAGLPVLTTAISGIPDLVTDGLTGLVCEAEAGAIARKVREYYAMPRARVDAIIDAARRAVRERHDVRRSVRLLLRVWTGRTVDILVVPWEHPAEHREVIDRLYRYTSLPFNLIACANTDRPDVVALLESFHEQRDNFTLVHNGYNAMVGPGTNRAMDAGTSDIAIYVCGREGFALRPGWEIPFVHHMAENARSGLAGTLCHAPRYLTGRQYPEALAEFPRFRNPGFARRNPDRVFRHVQGGLFAIRRAMYDRIGGFSLDVPHDFTDIEYSYYAESRGWQLGEVGGVMSLYNKTRPALAHRIDETVKAAHPPQLADLPRLDAVAGRRASACNVCGWSGASFRHAPHGPLCPSCGSTGQDRSAFHWLASSHYPYRRLPALAVGLDGEVGRFWKEQFQGPMLDWPEFLQAMETRGQLENRAGALHLAMLRGMPLSPGAWRSVFSEAARLLKPGSALVLQSVSGEGLERSYALPGEIRAAAEAEGFAFEGPAIHFSAALRLDWTPLFVFRRLGDEAPSDQPSRK